jgi:arsenical pump membrane protein
MWLRSIAQDSASRFRYRCRIGFEDEGDDETMTPHQTLLAWAIIVPAIAGVIIRPFRFPEAVWALAGAIALVLVGLLSPAETLVGARKGLDVYLFLIGMMLTAELARAEGLFDYLAAFAVEHARGSPQRLFLLIYAVGTLVTVLLSNDATAIVLTPAVYAATRAAGAAPLPYLLICAFIANAASFVLPISNPANLVIYGSRTPPLLHWLPQFALPSALAIVATYWLLRFTQRDALRQTIASAVPLPHLSGGGKIAAAGIVATAIVLLTASALDIQLGLPTCIAGALTGAIVLIRRPSHTWQVIVDIPWAILPLVAGLFVLVEALAQTGVIAALGAALRDAAAHSVAAAAWSAGIAVALASNLANNLPVALIAGSALHADHAAEPVTRAVLIGVDLGPNLSVTGSLATILGLMALRREGQRIGAGAFLRLGAIVMPPALLLAIAGALLPG